MAKIKVLVENGIAPADAIKACLGTSIRAFASKHRLAESAVSAVINGSTPYPYERVREALALELGVDREWLDALLDQQKAA